MNATSGEGLGHDESSGSGSLIATVRVCLEYRALIAGVTVTAAVVMAIGTLLMQPFFSSSVTFVPEVRSGPNLSAGLALASQLGLSLGGASPGASPRFYAQLATSRHVLERVLEARYPVPGGTAKADSATLLDLLEIRGAAHERRLEQGVRWLGLELVRARSDQATNVVEVTVDMPEPALAAAVATAILEQLQEFNVATRQSQARARRRFVEVRVAEAETALRGAEDALRRFLESNRQWESSPQLRFEYGRLDRRVQAQQEVYVMLQRELQTARIEEVNDTPVLSVIDSAAVPQRKSKPRRRALVLFAGVLGFGVGVALAMALDWLQRSSAGSAGLPVAPWLAVLATRIRRRRAEA